jgi:D-lactate dehydrogenase (cytochrome)
MDLIDLFIGSEGTLGIFPEIELRLVPVLPVLWGVVAFFPDESSALRFVHGVRGDNNSGSGFPTGLQPAAIEFYGHRALDLLRAKVEEEPGFAGIPELPEAFHTGVYVEFQGQSEDEVSDAVMAMSEIMVTSGGDEDATWLATEATEWQRLREFRHAIPETVNALIDERRKTESELTKLGTDMAVPNDKLDDILRLYREALQRSGLEHVMFGHISANHIHVNILPRSMEDYARGKELYLAWADEVIAMGGTVSAEHGIGKIKVSFLEKMYGKAGIDEMRAVKRVFDPENRLNPGNLFG